jgi:hypothetical protein
MQSETPKTKYRIQATPNERGHTKLTPIIHTPPAQLGTLADAENGDYDTGWQHGFDAAGKWSRAVVFCGIAMLALAAAIVIMVHK